MREVSYKCDLCKEENEEKYLFGVKYVRIEGDVRSLEFTKKLEDVDAHLCTGCICSITHADNKGAFRDY